MLKRDTVKDQNQAVTKRASSHQVAALTKLNAELTALRRYNHQPISAVASIIVTISLIQLLFINESGPFNWVFDTYVKQQVDDFFTQLNEGFTDRNLALLQQQTKDTGIELLQADQQLIASLNLDGTPSSINQLIKSYSNSLFYPAEIETYKNTMMAVIKKTFDFFKKTRIIPGVELYFGDDIQLDTLHELTLATLHETANDCFLPII